MNFGSIKQIEPRDAVMRLTGFMQTQNIDPTLGLRIKF
jgi:hypothetical protein